ncbi:hypothetical protein [Streptomyces cinnamoneus]|uniref:Uncharacterized protein n=1 Tax=Streptomyces cinnamoneus TaxID=53446 RepID=A0A918U1S1_STRCJ|nr:hypothetical protein [Streptomyces cinnamoneus]GHC72390.1 hypothetical protein GCM10010507_59410 [Streptomyces cinnamoneus]
MKSSPIDPILIPHFTGDVGALERDVAALAKDASNVRTTGANTHTTFQGLSSWYVAPEVKQLLDSTLPVRDKADHFADGLETVKSALATYASAIRPIVKELDGLREQAVAFRAEIGDSDRWLKDQSKVDRNAHLIRAVAVAQEKFHDAERDAFNKITGVFDKSLRLTVDDGTHKKGMYGYKPSDVEKATKTPWGVVEDREYDGLAAAWHWTSDTVTNVAKGFFVDGVGNAAKGLYHLVNFTDGKTFKETWNGLGTTVHGLGLYATKPFDMVFDQTMLRDKDGPDEIRAKKAAREFGKSFIAYDEWKTNPTRAGGTVAFNALTLAAGPLLKAGAAGKAGQAGAAGEAAGTAAAAARAAKAATALGTVGRYVDPVTYVQKATGLSVEATKLAIPKIGDIAAEVRQSLGRIGTHNPSSVELPTLDGKPQYLHPDGTIRDNTGIKHPGAEAPKEPSKHDLATPREATTTADKRVLAHSGATSHAAHGSSGHPASPASHSSAGGSGHNQGSGPVGHAAHQAGHGSAAPSSHQSHGSGGDPTSAHQHGHGTNASHGHAQPPHGHDPQHTSGDETASDQKGSGSGSDDGTGKNDSDGANSNSTTLDPEYVKERIKKLDDRQGGEGHAPGRHHVPDDATLKRRLGDPQLNADGTPKLLGPASDNVGHVKSQNNIDPLTGTTVDGVTGNPHRVGAYSTRFNNAEDMVRADEYFRNYIDTHGAPPDGPVPISDILGPEGHQRLTGFYRNPGKLDEFLPADFENGTITAVYRGDFSNGSYHLYTMYPNPALGRHP